MFTAQFIADQARNAGLNVYVGYSEDNDFTPIRISSGDETLQMVVTTRWTGMEEEIYSAKLIEPRYEGHAAYIPRLGQVDRFSGAHSFALLGWIVTEIQHMADEKAHTDRRNAASDARHAKAKADHKARIRANRKFLRQHQLAA